MGNLESTISKLSKIRDSELSLGVQEGGSAWIWGSFYQDTWNKDSLLNLSNSFLQR